MSPSVDVQFDGPLGNAVVSLIDKKTGTLIASYYNQQDINLTKDDDIPFSSSNYQCITQVAASPIPLLLPSSPSSPSSLTLKTSYK